MVAGETSYQSVVEIMLGFDDAGILRDVGWRATTRKAVHALVPFTERVSQALATFDFSGQMAKPGWKGKKADPAKVEAFILSSPENIRSFIDLYGKPEDIGIQGNRGDDPMIVSCWSFNESDETAGADRASGKKLDDAERSKSIERMTTSFLAISFSSLIAGHDVDGNVREMAWLTM